MTREQSLQEQLRETEAQIHKLRKKAIWWVGGCIAALALVIVFSLPSVQGFVSTLWMQITTPADSSKVQRETYRLELPDSTLSDETNEEDRIVKKYEYGDLTVMYYEVFVSKRANASMYSNVVGIEGSYKLGTEEFIYHVEEAEAMATMRRDHSIITVTVAGRPLTVEEVEYILSCFVKN